MIRDVKSYFQRMANRFSQPFLAEGFDTEHELEFWALAAEHVSRKAPPRFSDIVEWIDLLYNAPIHIVYKKEKDKLQLYRQQVLVENIRNASKAADKEFANPSDEDVRQLAEGLQQVDHEIDWNEEFHNAGVFAHSIGQCEHIPLFSEGKPWGIYCAGPYAQSPDSIKAKLQIVARILSNWMVELATTEREPEEEAKAKPEEIAGDLGLDRFELDQVAGLMLGYLATMKSAVHGGILELGVERSTFLAQHNLDERQVNWIIENITHTDSPSEFQKKLADLPGMDLDDQDENSCVTELTTDGARFLIFLTTTREATNTKQIDKMILDSLQGLMICRRQKLDISETLIDTYYQMLRQLEKKRKHTRNHTPRLMALTRQFGQRFGLDADEQDRLLLTARLHDVGYIVTPSFDQQMATEPKHPVVGSMIVEGLPVHGEIKEGIKTHHEWVDGTGGPNEVTGEEIPWNGKIVGLFEFVNEFVEAHLEDDSKTGEAWVELLSERLIDGADSQFDMMLVPTAIELIRTLGWQGCCELSVEDIDQ